MSLRFYLSETNKRRCDLHASLPKNPKRNASKPRRKLSGVFNCVAPWFRCNLSTLSLILDETPLLAVLICEIGPEKRLAVEAVLTPGKKNKGWCAVCLNFRVLFTWPHENNDVGAA